MRTAETRFVNQCTYTPISNSPEEPDRILGFTPNKPFLKRAILTTVFNEHDLGQFILDQLSHAQSGLDGIPHQELAAAVKQIWEGDITKSTELLNKIDADAVVRFAENSLAVQKSLLTTAKQNVEEAILSIAKQNGAGTDALAEVQHELATLRESILTEIRSSIIPSTATTVNLSAAMAQPGASTMVAPPDTVTSSPLQAAPSADSMLATLTRDSIQAELSQRSPLSAAYLATAKFFSLPMFTQTTAANETTHLLSFVALQEHVVEQKKKLLLALAEAIKVEPVGYLHLERLQFTPIGYERGELVYSLPMLPKETVRLTHREWSRTETEFVKIVATSLETATEDALSEKSELTESSRTQEQYNSAFSTSVSASGGYGPINISTSVGYNASHAQSRSREVSARHAREITKTASSRAKQEHKITFRVATQYEVEEQSFREFTNPSEHAVRFDFHRLMEKWRIDLYRYDIRLTYDIVIPEPGSYLLRKYITLERLNRQLAQPNPFHLSPRQITRTNWQSLMGQYTVTLDPPPAPYYYTQAHAEQTFSERVIGFDHLEITLPQDYEFDTWSARGSHFIQTEEGEKPKSTGFIDPMLTTNSTQLRAGAEHSSTYIWRYYYDWSEEAKAQAGSVMSITVWVRGALTDQAFQEWQAQCYARLVDAAAAKYESERQRLTQLRDTLQAELNREDALMLRKIEKEEIMKGVLRWLLGPDFSFYPQDLPDLKLDPNGDLEYYDKSSQSVKGQSYEPMFKHGELVKFLHQAIEWENVNYVLYPYFWTDDYRWDFKQFLYHNDYVHRNFLRAGAARVVLTIRPGFEKAFLSFMETGHHDQLLAPVPYMTVADELKAVAQTTYPYTPSAEEENPANLADTWYEFTPTGALDVVEGTTLPSGGSGMG